MKGVKKHGIPSVTLWGHEPTVHERRAGFAEVKAERRIAVMRYLLKPGDIVVGMDGEFRAYLWAGVESWLNQRVCVFAPKPGFSAAFVRSSIIAPLAEVEATETATTVIHLGKNDIDRFKVIVPDAPVIEAFTKVCQPWYDQIVANKQQSRTLATLHDTLLPKLLNGELSVAAVGSSAVAAPSVTLCGP